MASTVGSYPKVVAYDSLYTSVDKETLALLKQMLGSKVIVEPGNGPKQDGTADCGLFAIATCVSLATGSQTKDFSGQCETIFYFVLRSSPFPYFHSNVTLSR